MTNYDTYNTMTLTHYDFNPLTPTLAKTGRAACMFRVEDALSPTSPARYFFALKSCQLFRRHINQSETVFCAYIYEF